VRTGAGRHRTWRSGHLGQRRRRSKQVEWRRRHQLDRGLHRRLRGRLGSRRRGRGRRHGFGRRSRLGERKGDWLGWCFDGGSRRRLLGLWRWLGVRGWRDLGRRGRRRRLLWRRGQCGRRGSLRSDACRRRRWWSRHGLRRRLRRGWKVGVGRGFVGNRRAFLRSALKNHVDRRRGEPIGLARPQPNNDQQRQDNQRVQQERDDEGREPPAARPRRCRWQSICYKTGNSQGVTAVRAFRCGVRLRRGVAPRNGSAATPLSRPAERDDPLPRKAGEVR